MTPVRIISFGYLHGEAPAAHIVIDLREHFRDPHADPAMRELTARDPRVMAAVSATPGIASLVTAIAAAVRAFRSGPSAAPLTLAIGCAGGRHRSAAVALMTARALRMTDIPAIVEHRDIGRPVAQRTVTP